MTKKDLETLRSKHELAAKAAYDDCSFSDYNYEMGYVGALNYVLEHFDELCEETHQDKFMQRAIEEAKFYIREYFQSKYDCGWYRDEVEDHIYRAIDEGDAETIANYFIEIASEGFFDIASRKNIVRDFYKRKNIVRNFYN